MEDEYYIITKRGKLIKRKEKDFDEFKELANTISDIDMCVAFYYNDKPYVTQGGYCYYWPQIQIIDKNGYPTTYRKGNYIVKNIHKDIGTSYFGCRQIDLIKCDTQEIFPVYIYGDVLRTISYTKIEDFYNTLMMMLETLETPGNTMRAIMTPS